jgi:hypothetical protein
MMTGLGKAPPPQVVFVTTGQIASDAPALVAKPASAIPNAATNAFRIFDLFLE